MKALIRDAARYLNLITSDREVRAFAIGLYFGALVVLCGGLVVQMNQLKATIESINTNGAER